MTWWRLSTWFKKEEACPPPQVSHQSLAAFFFWLPRFEQLKFLYFLGVHFDDQSILHASMYPHPDVKLEMKVTGEPAEAVTATMFISWLKAIHLSGKRHYVIAVLQNMFRDKHEAEYYADRVLKWSPGKKPKK